MILTKTTFQPVAVDDGGFGKSENDGIVDGVIPVTAVCEKVAVTALDAIDKLNQPTPFVGVPSVVEGSET